MTDTQAAIIVLAAWKPGDDFARARAAAIHLVLHGSDEDEQRGFAWLLDHDPATQRLIAAVEVYREN
jgi:hypothetical protein